MTFAVQIGLATFITLFYMFVAFTVGYTVGYYGDKK